MKKYYLPPHLAFVDVATHPIPADTLQHYADLQQVQQGKLFLLYDEQTDKTMLVNPVIRAFLQLFQHPLTFAEALQQFAQQAQCTPAAIEPTFRQFFEDMRHRDIIARYQPTTTAAVDIPLLPEIGDSLDDYQIVERIREKSRIIIYKAIRKSDQREVALKLLKFPAEISAKKRKKRLKILQQEFALLHELQGHPNICEFLDISLKSPFPYAVMEYLDGYSWGRFIEDQQPDLSTKLTLANQLLSGMAFIHQQGILHGDLHSGNILVEESNLVKIIDFDLANRARPLKEEVLREGGVIHYIPPERISSTCFDTVNGAADFRSEVFQIGVILYRLFYEKMPFRGFTWRELTQAIKTQPAQLLRTTPQGEVIPRSIILILKKALTKEREQRFADAQQMKLYLAQSTLA